MRKQERKEEALDSDAKKLARAGVDFSLEKCRENPVLRMFRDNQIAKDGKICAALSKHEHEYDVLVPLGDSSKGNNRMSTNSSTVASGRKSGSSERDARDFLNGPESGVACQVVKIKNYLTCELCYDEEVLAQEGVQCLNNGHVYCYDCVRRYIDGLCGNDWGLNVLRRSLSAETTNRRA
jgi:hypothetical protein